MALTNFRHASRWGSGMLASTLLMSLGPKPVTVRLCFGRVIRAGPTGPLRSESGALVEGLRSRGAGETAAIFQQVNWREAQTGEGVSVLQRRGWGR
jgi:hypothetical protein